MKSERNLFKNAGARLLLMTIFGAFPLMRAQGQEACCLALPDYPGNSISADLTAYYPSPATAYSFMTAKVLAGPIPLAPPSQLYPAWCIDAATHINVDQGGIFTPYVGFLYSSCDTNLNVLLGEGTNPPEHPASVYVSPATWKKVNYVLNHRNLAAAPYTNPPFTGPPFAPLPSFAFYWDVQEVINAFVGGPRLEHYFTVNLNVSNALYTAAETYAGGWQPQCGVDKIAAIANFDPTPFSDPFDNVQLLILEVPFCHPIECPTNVMVECGQSLDPNVNLQLGFPANGPCCALQLGYSDTTNSGNCPVAYVITRTWNATNACGTTTCVQTITVNDTTPPVLVGVPTNMTYQCLGDVPAAATVTATDNCGPVSVVASYTTNGTCPLVITCRWTATDACTNSTSASRTITVNDTTPPMIAALPTATTINCPATPSFAQATAIDACDPTVTLTFSDVTTPGTCPGNYSVKRTWTATDDCGNSSTASQTINVQDVTAPVIVCAPDQTLQWVTGSTPVFGIPTASDTCDANVTITFEDSELPASLPAVRIFRRMWTATDDCMNSGSCSETITFVATTQPAVLVDGVFHPENNAIATNHARIEVQSSVGGGTIRYSLNGAPPARGILYTGAFVVTQPVLVRTIVFAPDFSSSSESDAVLVDVVIPPFIITQPSGRMVGTGAEVSMSVTAGGTAPLSFQWEKNGVAVPGATGPVLLLSDIQPGQSGDYTMIITNDFGAVTSAVAKVMVLGAPSILSQPTNVTVNVGGTATFSVLAVGPPTLLYQWRKNGANILAATNDTFTITNVQFDDGGSYTVVVASPGGTVVSDPALLIVTAPSPPPGDDFSSTNALVGASGAATGTNNLATREPGEPLHAGKPGTNSVWYMWVAPATGVATFRTTGSTFDTLMGIYTGTSVANLTTVVSDEDGGGFLASRVSFNATSGTVYHIAMDGFNGQQGSFVLRWDLLPTASNVAEIVCPPQSLTVQPGENATFTVSATGPSLAYQWLFNGVEIWGATRATYTRLRTQPFHVGFYSVRVTSTAMLAVESAPALLEIGPDHNVQSRDKPEDVDAACPGSFRAATGASSVAMGSVGYQILVSSSTNNLIDCNTTNCGGIPTGTRYLELQPLASGTFLLDTMGSASRTKLWVCRAGTNNLDKSRTYLTCDVDSASDGRSIVSFNAEAGRTYQVWISKLDTTNGILQVNWKLGLPPRIASLSSNRFVMEGTTTTLNVSATNVVSAGVPATNALGAPTYAWYFNGPTPVATGPTLNLNNLKATDAGQYVVVARNEVGTTSAVVRVEIFGASDMVVVNSGGTTELFADATTAACGGIAARYQWRLNGALLTGKTNRNLVLQGMQPTQAGQYSVTASNCFGAITYVAASVAVTVDVGFTAEIVAGQVLLRWQTTPGKRYRVEYRATLDGGSWTAFPPDLIAIASSLTFVDPLGAMPRFYRIVLLD